MRNSQNTLSTYNSNGPTYRDTQDIADTNSALVDKPVKQWIVQSNDLDKQLIRKSQDKKVKQYNDKKSFSGMRETQNFNANSTKAKKNQILNFEDQMPQNEEIDFENVMDNILEEFEGLPVTEGSSPRARSEQENFQFNKEPQRRLPSIMLDGQLYKNGNNPTISEKINEQSSITYSKVSNLYSNNEKPRQFGTFGSNGLTNLNEKAQIDIIRRPNPRDVQKLMTIKDPAEEEDAEFREDGVITLFSLQYTSGEDEMEEGIDFKSMKKFRQLRRAKHLWHRAIKKAIGAVKIIYTFRELNMDLYLYGSNKKHEFSFKERKPYPFIVMPNTKISNVWNIVMMFLMLYTATYIPYKTSFIDETSTLVNNIELAIDSLFMWDLIMNFISAYEDSDKNIEFRFNIIAFQLPRLYKLLRILRLMKMFRLLKYNRNVKKMMEKLRINPGYLKLIKVSATVLLLVHLVSCFYFMVAKFQDFDPNCWVVYHNLIDKEAFEQYITAMYWAFQTLTTVGYGDVTGNTSGERIFAFVWMVFGVAFYSFTIGNLQSIISTIDIKAVNLQQKLRVLNNFAKRTKLPEELTLKIKRFVENNNENDISIHEYKYLLGQLPQSLRADVIQQSFGNIIRKIVFLQDKNSDFLWFFLPALRPMKVYSKDILYNQGDHPEEVFFIQQGRVKLCYNVSEDDDFPFNIPFNMYVQGSYFGDLEILVRIYREIGRDSTAIVDSECHLFVIGSKELRQILKMFQDIAIQMKKTAKKRGLHHQEMIKMAKLKANEKKYIAKRAKAEKLFMQANAILNKLKPLRKKTKGQEILQRAKASKKQLQRIHRTQMQQMESEESQMSIIKEESRNESSLYSNETDLQKKIEEEARLAQEEEIRRRELELKKRRLTYLRQQSNTLPTVKQSDLSEAAAKGDGGLFIQIPKRRFSKMTTSAGLRPVRKSLIEEEEEIKINDADSDEKPSVSEPSQSSSSQYSSSSKSSTKDKTGKTRQSDKTPTQFGSTKQFLEDKLIKIQLGVNCSGSQGQTPISTTRANVNGRSGKNGGRKQYQAPQVQHISLISEKANPVKQDQDKYDNKNSMRLFQDTASYLALNAFEMDNINLNIVKDFIYRDEVVELMSKQEDQICNSLDKMENLLDKIMQSI
ncbi:UNKNOWN [Stylonychia lemnae]|uniref:Cyclic nucleotide-binding domain-containing protein n=1 Tax=Stylonychia lemnae TaxID=5949 RepID=A0A078AWS3_STYLE|nr:UNKNOWN [Stylonychia lemnae]|eukprot:CDW85707.1 UNKNOWN [Stylonychia lemnae]